MGYDAYPRGIYLTNHAIAKGTKLGGDFVVAYMGRGIVPSNKFCDHVQTAADSGLPLVAYYANDPGAFVEQYQSLNLAKWLESPKDSWVVKEVLDKMFLSGGVKRQIAALIVDMNDIIETSEKTFPDDWVISTALFIGTVAWRLYGVPTYFAMDPEIAAQLPHGLKDKLTTFFASLVRYDESAKVGRPGIMEGMATFHDSFNGPALPATWDSLPFPNDSAVAELRKKKIESGLGNAPRTSFWCFSAGDFRFPDVGLAAMFLYVGSKERLYEELKWNPVPNDPEDPKPEDPKPEDPKPGDPAGPSNELLADILDQLIELNARIEALSTQTLTIVRS